jgi:hypothetical protein
LSLFTSIDVNFLNFFFKNNWNYYDFRGIFRGSRTEQGFRYETDDREKAALEGDSFLRKFKVTELEQELDLALED